MNVLKTKTDLVSKAIETADIYCAAAVYDIANSGQRKILQSLMFEKRSDALKLARWEHTPERVLLALYEKILSNSNDAKSNSAVLMRLDKNPNTPSQALSLHCDAEISAKKKQSLILLVAQHQHTPMKVLESIARFSSDIESLSALSRNASANAGVLSVLVNRLPSTLDKNVAGHSLASADLLMHIYERGDVYTQAAVIGHGNCPYSLIQKAEGECDLPLPILRQLAKDARLSKPFLAKLAANKDVVVRVGVANNVATCKRLIRQLQFDASAVVRRVIATRCDLTIASIKVLMSDKDVWVRQWLARNLRTPSKLIAQLSQDKQADVRRAVARNPRCPIAMLDLLARDENAWVRAAVAYQKRTPKRLLELLAEDTDIDVLSGVANNHHTPQKMLQTLALSVEADIRRGVILNHNATRKTLLPLLEDSYYLHRLMLVTKPQLKEDDIWHLCDDPDFRVRFMAFSYFAK